MTSAPLVSWITQLQGGYPVEWFQTAPHEELVCGICSNVVRQPPNLVVCPHLFCRSCLTKAMRNHSACPMCRTSLNQSVNALAICAYASSQVIRLPILCPTTAASSVEEQKDGSPSIACTWRSCIGTDERNLLAHQNECAFVEVVCPLGCDAHIPRKNIESHTTHECSMRLVICRICLTSMMFSALVDPKHAGVNAIDTLLTCSASAAAAEVLCGNVTRCAECTCVVPSNALALHRLETCTERMIECIVCGDDDAQQNSTDSSATVSAPSLRHTLPWSQYTAHIESMPRNILVDALFKATRSSKSNKELEIGDMCDVRDIKGVWHLVTITGKHTAPAQLSVQGTSWTGTISGNETDRLALKGTHTSKPALAMKLSATATATATARVTRVMPDNFTTFRRQLDVGDHFDLKVKSFPQERWVAAYVTRIYRKDTPDVRGPERPGKESKAIYARPLEEYLQSKDFKFDRFSDHSKPLGTHTSL
jgi:hypothetical protein